MSFEDKTLHCSDCGTKEFTNEPKRCVQCRRAKKQNSGSANYSSSFSRR
jgi:hypothetical protein